MEAITRRGFIGLGVAAAAAAAGLPACAPPVQAAPSASSSAAAPEDASSSAAAADVGSQLACGGQSGVYWAAGQGLAQAASGAPAAAPVEALVSDGAVANVAALADGSADFAYCQADVAAWARDGEGPFQDAPVAFAEVAGLYDEFVQLVTRDVKVKTPADLDGKRVSLGAPGSGTYCNALDVLGAYGLTEEDITPTYQGFGDSAVSLAEGQIDAAFFVAGAPTPAISDLFGSAGDARLVSLDKAHVADLVAASPHYAEAALAAGTYASQGEETATVSVRAVLLAAEGATEAEVAQVAAALPKDEPAEEEPGEGEELENPDNDAGSSS